MESIRGIGAGFEPAMYRPEAEPRERLGTIKG
jgi:hypothetical protein